MRAPSIYTALHKKHWERVKQIDFASGPVAVRSPQGKAEIRRPHSRRVLRQMARDAARREVKQLCSKPIQFVSK